MTKIEELVKAVECVVKPFNILAWGARYLPEVREVMDKSLAALPELRALTGRVAELEEALKTFAEEWEWAKSCGPRPDEWLKYHRTLTWHFYAKAAAVLRGGGHD